MLSIGEFSKICQVSTKTLRYYAEIGLIYPDEVNPENGYRYYSIHQLETMLFINRLKSYAFSLDEISTILHTDSFHDDTLYHALMKKKQLIEKQKQAYECSLLQLHHDLETLQQGKSIMSYLDDFDIQLVEVPAMQILSIRTMVMKEEFADSYGVYFGSLFKKIATEALTILSPPMVLFHSDEYTTNGLDTEFAIGIQESLQGSRTFQPGLCLKTILKGSYTNLPSVYAKQMKWAEDEGYENTNALFEIYIVDPSLVQQEKDLITEIYYPVTKT